MVVHPAKRRSHLVAKRTGDDHAVRLTWRGSWGKAEAHVWLGQVYEQMKERDKAAAEYTTALEIEPGFVWAKNLLAGK